MLGLIQQSILPIVNQGKVGMGWDFCMVLLSTFFKFLYARSLIYHYHFEDKEREEKTENREKIMRRKRKREKKKKKNE